MSEEHDVWVKALNSTKALIAIIFAMVLLSAGCTFAFYAGLIKFAAAAFGF